MKYNTKRRQEDLLRQSRIPPLVGGEARDMLPQSEKDKFELLGSYKPTYLNECIQYM